eukprot:5613569-Prorocentrum_lima.AAC.1
MTLSTDSNSPDWVAQETTTSDTRQCRGRPTDPMFRHPHNVNLSKLATSLRFEPRADLRRKFNSRI